MLDKLYMLDKYYAIEPIIGLLILCFAATYITSTCNISSMSTFAFVGNVINIGFLLRKQNINIKT